MVSLKEFIEIKRPDLRGRLKIFIAICEQIRRLHAEQIVHNDINLETCRIDIQTESVKILISDAAVKLSEPKQVEGMKNRGGIGGQIAYISPERTGRTAHPVDIRSDCYSLGVVLYHLLTGRIPFDFKQPRDIIHAHIALPPVPVADVNKTIPLLLSNITSKLLAKNPADRYQSLSGLISDLKTGLHQLETSAAIEKFPLAARDVSPIFEIPAKLYGRYREVQLLCSAYRQVLEGGRSEAIFFNGPPGIGKSFLVNNVQPFLMEEKGHFISGKFDQFEKTIPYSAIIQAFSVMVQRLLTLNQKELEKKRCAILNSVGLNSRLIVDVIPALELVIERQPEPQKLPPMEARNRFNYAFQKFVQSITSEADPIIIFLDDLQWADRASLELMEAVLLDSELRNLLFIGAYRSIEAKDNPFLEKFLERMARHRSGLQVVSLESMDDEYIEILIKDMLSVDLDGNREFVRLIAEKTNCNPLVIREFLIHLHEEGLIRYIHADKDVEADGWRIDMAGVAKARLPDTIVALLIQRIRKLSSATQDILAIAACIGTQFYTDLLLPVYPGSVDEIRAHLKEAFDQGMLVGIERGYKFIHDRVREAFYQLNDANQRVKIHYTLGRSLMSVGPRDESNDIFLMVSQLNSARPLLCMDECRELIRLNLSAGKRAKQLNAFATALEYFDTALGLLDEDTWKRDYALTLDLHTEAAETAHMCNKLDKAETLVSLILRNAQSYLDQVGAYDVRISCLSSQNKFPEMLREGAYILKCLGCVLPENPGNLRILWEWIALKWALRNKTMEELQEITYSQDYIFLAKNRIIGSIWSSAYRILPNLFKFLVLNSLRESLKHGGLPDTAVYLSHYGLLLGMTGKIEAGYDFGQLSLALAERSLMNPHAKALVLLGVNGILSAWKNHFKDTLSPLLETYRFCMTSGNLAAASNTLAIYFNNLIASGTPLPEVLSKVAYFYEIMRQQGQKTAIDYLSGVRRQIVSNYTGQPLLPGNLQGSEPDTEEMVATYSSSDDRPPLIYLYFSNLAGAYHNADYVKALRNSNRAFKLIKETPPSSTTLRIYWYDSLNRLALIQADATTQKTHKRAVWRILVSFCSKRYHLIRVFANQRILKRWGRHAPMNCMNKWNLVEAERANVCGQKKQAEDYYHQAVGLSRKYGFLHEEALANELLSRFYRHNFQSNLAEKHLKAAIDLYQKWGGEIQRTQLLREYRTFFDRTLPKTESNVEGRGANRELSGKSQSVLTPAEMELELISAGLDAISNPTDLKTGLIQLSDQILHYSGAQRVLLLINRKELSIGVDKHIEKDANVLPPIQADMDFPASMIHYAARTGESLLIENAGKTEMFATDPYIRKHKVKSAICIPMIYQGRFTAALYLENNLCSGVFIPPHLKALQRLGGQLALFLEKIVYKELFQTELESVVPPDRLFTILVNQFGLTHQEAKIALLFKEGRTRPQISDLLNITSTTLRKHLQTIYDKTINMEDNFSSEGRVDKLSRLILFLFKQAELSK